MTIPHDDIVKRVMTFLVERYTHQRTPIISVADLIDACALGTPEYQSIFHLFFQAGVFTPIGTDKLQVGQLVGDYASRLTHCSLNDVMQFFQGHRSRNRLVRVLGAFTALYAHREDAATDDLLILCPNVEAEVIAHFAKNPEELFSLHPRKFEELVASIFRNNNFEVELTPPTRDGGVDIIAVERSVLTGRSIHLIECKRYAPENKVGIDIVQRLAGVVTQKRATKGLVVTTSSFTKDAITAARETENILTLRDYEDLVAWLNKLGEG